LKRDDFEMAAKGRAHLLQLGGRRQRRIRPDLHASGWEGWQDLGRECWRFGFDACR
jgi:hypothetical protein